MAGAGITIDINDAQIIAALNRLQDKMGGLKPMLGDYGEYLLRKTRKHFEDQKGPDGRPWEPLQYDKPYNQDKILILDGHLMGELAYNAGETALEFGSNKIYAATQQFGRDEKNIPARPFLGINADDKQELIDTIADYLQA